jgi:hypothetical protein
VSVTLICNASASKTRGAASLPCYLVTLQPAGERARKGFQPETEFGVPYSERGAVAG